MNTKANHKNTPVRPYDDSVWDHLKMYDNAPYVWDVDLSNENVITLVSGNIIKSYRCLVTGTIEVKH